MGCVSTDGPNFLPAGEKVVGHYMSGVAACSEYDVHKLTSMLGLDAGGWGLDSGETTISAEIRCRKLHRAHPSKSAKDGPPSVVSGRRNSRPNRGSPAIVRCRAASIEDWRSKRVCNCDKVLTRSICLPR
jgi:hypothetical protein